MTFISRNSQNFLHENFEEDRDTLIEQSICKSYENILQKK